MKFALRAFSLVEVLIAVTLMSVIVIGLMAMFGQTQRAFRLGITQTDVMESGRAALELMAREMEQAQATGITNSLNFEVQPVAYQLVQALPPGSGDQRTNLLQSVRFATRTGQDWTGIGYAVWNTNVVGALYRYQTNTFEVPVPPNSVMLRLDQLVQAVGNPRRVIDGVVSLKINTYDWYGRLISPGYSGAQDPNQIVPTQNAAGFTTLFYGNALPAYVEIELGILEAKTLERVRNLPATAQQAFLEKQVGHVQVFRQRVPIRNVDPSVYQ